jgi:phosphoinositide-3-kinase regulatory subunit 4
MDGQEKHIGTLLETKSLELFPRPLPDLGPRVKIVKTLGKLSNHTPQQNWKPKKIMMTRFPEHCGAVNQIVMAPDHSFFASCSKDGTGVLVS